MAVLHLAGGWALLQAPAVRTVVRTAVLETAPLMVALLVAPATSTPPAATHAIRPLPARVMPAPMWAAPSLAPLPLAADTAAAPSLAPSPAPAAMTLATLGTSTSTSPALPAPPAPMRKRLSADAVGYRVPPPAEVPLASRRAGESGVVWLRVVVDVHGLPTLVQVQRSSGYPRLDAQAVAAMHQARFRPHTEDGVAVELEVIAPIEYPLE